MTAAMAAVATPKNASEQALDLWLGLRSMLLSNVNGFNVNCRDCVWSVKVQESPGAAVHISFKDEARDCVEISFDPESSAVTCRYGTCARRESLTFLIRTGGSPSYMYESEPVSLSAVSDAILMPLLQIES